MKKIFILLTLIFFGKENCHSQSIRINYLGVNNPIETPGAEEDVPLYLGIGYEQNIGDRIAISLEYNVFYSESNINSLLYNDHTASGFSYIYGLAYAMREIGYQSKYFFSDNNERSTYISSGLALLTVNYKWKLSNQYSNNSLSPVPSDFKEGSFNERKTIIPFTLRLGYRGSINGGFGDYGIGFRYNLSGDKTPTDQTYKKYIGNVSKSSVKDLSFIFCMSWGFGWAK